MSQFWKNDLSSISIPTKGLQAGNFNAIITIDAMEDTYQVEGKDIDINTQQGELIVKLSGMKEAGMKAFRFFKGEKVRSPAHLAKSCPTLTSSYSRNSYGMQ